MAFSGAFRKASSFSLISNTITIASSRMMGMSFRRLLRPYLISAAIIAAATFVLSAYIIPPANVKRIEYTNRYVRNKSVSSRMMAKM